MPEAAWRPAARQDGEVREGAWGRDHRPARPGRLATRLPRDRARERPHPGAQLSFSDHDGHRFLATLTELAGDPVELERLHRARASTEDRIRAAKQTGLENLPFRDFDHNAVWLELSLIAPRPDRLDPTARADGDLAICEPQDAALPTAAHRRPRRLPRPPLDPAPSTHLALGRRPRHGVRAPRRAAPPAR
jgi:hypothetical protein